MPGIENENLYGSYNSPVSRQRMPYPHWIKNAGLLPQSDMACISGGERNTVIGKKVLDPPRSQLFIPPRTHLRRVRPIMDEVYPYF